MSQNTQGGDLYHGSQQASGFWRHHKRTTSQMKRQRTLINIKTSLLKGSIDFSLHSDPITASVTKCDEVDTAMHHFQLIMPQ